MLNRVLPRARLTEEMLAEMMAMGVALADARIGNRVAFAAALAEGRSVGETQPRGRAAEEIGALAEEILRIAG